MGVDVTERWGRCDWTTLKKSLIFFFTLKNSDRGQNNWKYFKFRWGPFLSPTTSFNTLQNDLHFYIWLFATGGCDVVVSADCCPTRRTCLIMWAGAEKWEQKMWSKHQSKARATAWSSWKVREAPQHWFEALRRQVTGPFVISPGRLSLEQKNTAVHHIKGMWGSMNKITTTTTARKEQKIKTHNIFFPHGTLHTVFLQFIFYNIYIYIIS